MLKIHLICNFKAFVELDGINVLNNLCEAFKYAMLYLVYNKILGLPENNIIDIKFHILVMEKLP